MTTAIYPNRQDDKLAVETVYGWQEDGDRTTAFCLKDGTLFAVGYSRIVYGDHGPYVEFEASDIIWDLVKKFPDPQREGIYYVWMHPHGYPGVEVYYQLRTVADMPNAPQRPDGRRSAYGRAEGYADYGVGMYYVAPGEFLPPSGRLFR